MEQDDDIRGELKRLADQVDGLQSREEIREVLNSMARAADRCDVELQKSCFHPGGTDYRGVANGDFRNCADTLSKWDVTSSRHCIQNISFNFLDRDTANVETYVDAFHFWDAEEKFEFIQARYLDRFERRNGVWKIARRMTVWDECWMDSEKPSWLTGVSGEYVKQKMFMRSTRDKDDFYYSYELPEELREFEPG